ncbi:MAG TPA: hypothetical protein VGP07_26015 [Polyangia bacterium]|jgi:hypothetical protein
MARVALIVTGSVEKAGLAASLQRAFPGTEFETQQVDSFTSSRVGSRPSGTSLPGVVDKLARALVAAVEPGRNGTPPDLAIAVDDLELVNLDQPGIVVEEFRKAVDRHVNEHDWNEPRRSRARDRLRARASFHLMVPMIEAYFFASSVSLAAAGVIDGSTSIPDGDPEAFAATDPVYLGASPGQDPSRWPNSSNWAKAGREGHPKWYLQYLLEPTSYRETKQGLAALKATHWRSIVAKQASQLCFARSLLSDLARGLDLPEGTISGDVHPSTSGVGRVLRNI